MKTIAISNNDTAIKNLYYKLMRTYSLTEDDLIIDTGHTTCLLMEEEVFFRLQPHISSYCEGYESGHEEYY